jgi:hypothetical protein
MFNRRFKTAGSFKIGDDQQKLLHPSEEGQSDAKESGEPGSYLFTSRFTETRNRTLRGIKTRRDETFKEVLASLTTETCV